jgi:hypothetical protein
VIIIRFIGGTSGCLIGALAVLAIPGILLLYWSSAQTGRNPASPPYQTSCRFGVYNSLDKQWKPLVGGRLPAFTPPSSAPYAIYYATKVTIFNESTSQDLNLSQYNQPGVTLTGGTWFTDSQGGDWQQLVVPPGGSTVAYEPMSNNVDTNVPPTGCTIGNTP